MEGDHGGVYAARCVDSSGRVVIPQLFGTTMVPLHGVAGAQPAAGEQGWCSFVSGLAEYPIWLGSSAPLPVAAPAPLVPAPGVQPISVQSIVPYIAGAAISGHRVVRLAGDGLVYHSSADDMSHLGKSVGISSGAAAPGDEVQVVISGRLAEPSWSWDEGAPIFLGLNGHLTHVAPSTVNSIFSQIVAFALSPTEIGVNMNADPIVL